VKHSGSIAVATLLLTLPLLASAQSGTRISSQKPILNFSLPTFTHPDGFRDWLIRGSEALVSEEPAIDVKELNVTIFTGDASNRIDTLLLSPAARVLPEEKIITSAATLRVINTNDGFEATGEGWKYTHQDKTVTLHAKVRVVLQAEFKNLLQ
jgi:lipopolysaccharide export system protein LptC